jgi:hypothetical protein
VPSEEVVVRMIEDELIIVPLVVSIGGADNELYTMNETGKASWSHTEDQNRSAPLSMN